MIEDSDRALRILSIYERLIKGDTLKRKKLADKYKVSTKTISREIKDLNIYLTEFGSIYFFILVWRT